MYTFSDLREYIPKEEFDNISKSILTLLDIPTIMLRKIDMNKLVMPKTSMFIGCRSEKDIKIDTEFNVLFEYFNVENIVNTKAILKYVSVNPSYEIDSLPCGYYGICLVDFPNGIPSLIDTLRPENEKSINMLYLTQKDVMSKLLSYI